MRRRTAVLLAAVPLAAIVLLSTAGPALAAPPAAGDPACDGLPLPSELRYEKDRYERELIAFLSAGCYLGWHHDRQIRFTGPSVAHLARVNGMGARWQTDTYGTHDAVLIYYSPDVFRWMCEREIATGGHLAGRCRQQCPDCRVHPAADDVPPIADGAMILKQMYGPTSEELLSDPDPAHHDVVGMALMVKDAAGAADGWWWGSWDPSLSVEAQLDWPPPTNFPYPWMGFGYYCLNCHASAAHESTFSEIGNVLGDADDFLTFYAAAAPPTAGAPQPAPVPSHHALVTDPDSGDDGDDGVDRVSEPRRTYTRGFRRLFDSPRLPAPTWADADGYAMPPEPYDHVVAPAGAPPQYLTSDQCVGCHAAGSTGIQLDMTVQPAAGGKLVDLSPYGEWRASPMGLAGRDPIFLSQLETERTLHAGLGDVIPDLCLHCHGVMGQRQFCRDQFPDDPERCSHTGLNPALPGQDPGRELFNRGYLDAVPFRAKTPQEQQASVYGGLARDGISCTVCHHVEVSDAVERDFGNTFTGDFRVGPPAVLNGPFPGPQQVPMDHSLGIKPEHDARLGASQVCGSCHSVVLPVFDGDEPYDPHGGDTPEFIIEQATYPEWVFSDFAPGGPLEQSCQDCHMRPRYPGVDGVLESKIASIQEASNFPETDNRRSKTEIDLDPRSPFARHTLVGLNVFFVSFAQQFPDLLGIRIQDPMLTNRKGVAPLATAFDSMVEQARNRTATVAVTAVERRDGALVADVRVTSLVGHKFPSGVGFRRLFLELAVLDGDGRELWVSGRTDHLGVIVDGAGEPVRGELWWRDGCQPMSTAEQQDWFQPHYTEITRQDQAQIYQEVVMAPDRRLTTSFLAIAHTAKDNRLLPRGWNPTVAAGEAAYLGSDRLSVPALVEDVMPTLPAAGGGTVDDPWYVPRQQGGLGGGGDALTYRVPLADLGGEPAEVRATLYSQSIPPFYLQDRFCVAPTGRDTQRLYFLAGHTDLDGTAAEGWKLQVVSSGEVGVPLE